MPGKEAMNQTRRFPRWRWIVRGAMAYIRHALTVMRRGDLPFVGVVFIATRAMLILATWRFARLTRPAFLTDLALHPLWHTWQRWDAIYYARIALGGYAASDVAHLPAFFPLFPLLERLALPLVGGDIALAGLLVANVAWFMALAEIAALARMLSPVPLAGQGAVVALSAFPTAFFGFVAYPESLFLALAIASFRRMLEGHWWAAAALGLVAALTRQAGVLLALPFLWEYGRQHGWHWRQFRPDVLLAFAFPAGLGIFAVVLWCAVGDPLAFVHAQASWHRIWAWPWQTLWWGLLAAARQPMPYFTFRAWQELTTAMLMIALAGIAVRRIPLSSSLFAVPALLLMLSQPAPAWPLLSQSRFALELFPLFVVLGIWLGHQQWRIYAWIGLGFPLQVAFVVIFAHAGWII